MVWVRCLTVMKSRLKLTTLQSHCRRVDKTPELELIRFGALPLCFAVKLN